MILNASTDGLALPGGHRFALADHPLRGRQAELSRLRPLIEPGVEPAGRVLVLLGDAGLGKSALLTNLAAQASATGLRVLPVAGRAEESGRAFAGLHRLLRPVLVDLLGPSSEQAGELPAALGLIPPDAEPDRFLAAIALLRLLGQAAGGVLLLVDDAQWLDHASLGVLAIAAQRMARPVRMILAARGRMPPAGFQRGVAELRLAPLATADANELLDDQPCPPCGRSRAQVLAQAAGNPLALIELTRAVAADPAAGQRWAGLPLPLTDRLSAMVAAQLAGLPAATRHALLLAAVTDDADRDPLARAGLTPDPAALAPAEELGLIAVDTGGARFRHPLIRSAVYHGVPFASRAAAHREIAAALRQEPDRSAWHLGAAALAPDEHVAAQLTATAGQAQQRGGATAAALALERAAELSPDPARRAARLVAAAEVAVPTGQAEWAQQLAARALALTIDRELRLRAQRVTGWALAWSGRYASADDVLLPLAREAAGRSPVTAWDVLAFAATAAYQAGDPDRVRAVGTVLARLPAAASAETQALRLWTLAVTGGHREAADLLQRLGPLPLAEHHLSRVGAAAWLLDRPTQAIGLLHTARGLLADPEVRAASAGPLAALGWACLDAGQWDDALELLAAPGPVLATGVIPAAASLITATIEAARGDTGRARALVAAALAADPEHSRLVTARARHALGLAALADGDHVLAFSQLGPLFAADGTPYHYHASYLAVGDLAVAAARAGRRLAGADLLHRITGHLAAAGPPPSPRVRQLLARAGGILADPGTPGGYPAGLLDDRAGDQWPFDRAQLRLEVGEWLRRRRRINEAKPVLGAALEVFRALHARPWANRAEAELRACGITAPDIRTDGLGELTPQQRQIVGLAARGLSNQAIAERMFLSPRTVASHLYRSFPKLGVAGRHQLRDLLAETD